MSDSEPKVTFSLEQRISERDKLYEQRFSDVAQQITSLDGKVEHGFALLREDIKSAQSKPAQVGVGLLISMLSFVVVCITLASGGVMLVVQPIKEALEHHREEPGHTESMPRVVAMESQIAELRRESNRHTTQLDDVKQVVSDLAISNAENDSASQVQRDNHARWLLTLSQHMERIEQKADDGIMDLHGRASALEASRDYHFDWTDSIDSEGSRRWVEDQHQSP